MKKNQLSQDPYVQLLLTILVAFILSLVAAALLTYCVGLLNALSDTNKGWINAASSAFFGLVVGYRLHAIVASDTKPKRKK